MEWAAHSFLAFIPSGTNEIRPLLGFSWGFSIEEELISLDDLVPIGSRGWNAHVRRLGAQHPGWHFAEGYHGG
jgi:hypothetical protein